MTGEHTSTGRRNVLLRRRTRGCGVKVAARGLNPLAVRRTGSNPVIPTTDLISVKLVESVMEDAVLVDPIACSLSAWAGDLDRCRWCNETLGPRRRVWHDGSCMKMFREQHRYTQARRWCLRKAKGKCLCLRPKGSHRHAVCAHCGTCETVLLEQGLKLECNHIKPRLGDKSSFSCLHHHDNLEMLCSPCHLAETNLQRLLYPEMSRKR